MSFAIFSDPRLLVILLRFDAELAEQARAKGCRCGACLHSARYPRKPRAPIDLGDWRHSFCCAVCRQRTTPPSVRFLGRHVYAFPFIILVTALTSGVSSTRLAVLRKELAVDRRTLDRWRTWWRETFLETNFWKVARARFSPPVDLALVPASLLDRFIGEPFDRLVSALRFLSPMSLSTRAL